MAKAAENTNKNAKPGFVERCKNFFKGIGKSFKNMYHELKKKMEEVGAVVEIK